LTAVPEFNSAEPHIDVFFKITNTGKREGAEVAQVYVGEDRPPVPRPEHELKGFARVALAPGETKQVKVTLDKRAFSYWDVTSKSWKIDSGKFTISVGDSVENLSLKASVEPPK
jgi:beta-glucosidase